MSKANTILRTPGVERRLKRWSDNSIPLPRSLSASAIAQTLASERKQKKGSGEYIPQPLDLTGISAPGASQACHNPKYQTIECHHGNCKCVPLRCGKCDGCRQYWRRKVRALVGEGCQGHVSHFVTLTFKEYPHQIEGDRYDFAQQAWHRLLKLAHKQGITFQYLRVVELQKRGTPHFHLVVNRIARHGHRISATTQVSWLFRELAKHTGFGHIMDCQQVKYGGAGAASYLSKYLSKTEVWSMKRADGRSIRRYCRSEGWCNSDQKARFRFRAVGGVRDTALYYPEPTCECYRRQRIRENLQAARWLDRAIREDTWCAPMALFDWILVETQIGKDT